MVQKTFNDKAISVRRGLRISIPIRDAKHSIVHVTLDAQAAKGLAAALTAYSTRSSAGLNDSAAFPGTVEVMTDADRLSEVRRLR